MKAEQLAGEIIAKKLTNAPGNGAAIKSGPQSGHREWMVRGAAIGH